MKCTDCISVCPKNALYFGFGKPASVRGKPAGKPSRRYNLSLAEEVFVAAVFMVTTWLVFRGLYDGPPLLMSAGLGGITAYLALQLCHLWNKPGVRIQNLTLKSGGRVKLTGWVFAGLTAAWLVFTAHSGFVQWHRQLGSHHLNRTLASREEVLSGEFRLRTYPASHHEAAEKSFRHFRQADRWGLAGVPEVKLGLAWGHLLRGEPAQAEEAIRAAVALAPQSAGQLQNLADFLVGQRRLQEAADVMARKIELVEEPGANDYYSLAGLLALTGRYDEALGYYLASAEKTPDFGPARYNAGGILRRQGKLDAAVDQLVAARDLMPDDADVHVELGLAYEGLDRIAEAVAALERALELDPGSGEARHHFTRLMGRVQGP